MPNNVELLLLESVENLGIVGDVVRVKSGYARNYLLPMGLAEPPSPSKIEALKEARAQAQAELARLRSERERLVDQLAGVSVEVERSCNDQGALYGSVTHRDVADALQEAGYGVGVRSVRLAHPIRRIGTYTVPIQFDKDLRTEIGLAVKADRDLEGYTPTGEPVEREEPEAGEEEAAGEQQRRPRRQRGEEREAEAASEA